MKSPFDQNAEQEPSSQQSYERNLSRNYAPSERARVRALDQRAAFNEATLKQRAEVAGANAEIARSRLGLAEQRAGIDQIRIQIAEEKAKLAENNELTKAKRELKVISDANGFLNDAQGMDPSRPSFDTQLQGMMAGYPDAFESKTVQEWANYHVPIAKSRREREDLLAKEERAKEEANRKFVEEQNKQVLQNEAAGELAKRLNLKPTGIRDNKVVFGDDTPAPTGTRRVTTDSVGRQTVSETTPMPPVDKPTSAAPAAPAAAPATPAVNPLASIVSSGGKIKKVGDSYNAFDKDGKFIGSYSVGK